MSTSSVLASEAVRAAAGPGKLVPFFHLVVFAKYFRVWTWHFGSAASMLPGANAFGWFFRYLTFWSYTAQAIQFGIIVLAHFTKAPKTKKRLEKMADILSCALFTLANTVTVMFYTVESATQSLVEDGEALVRPWWLAESVHALNSAAAWLDLLLVEQRTFSHGSRGLAVGLAMAYVLWILAIKQLSGRFPYPILNKLPMPAGLIGFTAAGILILLTIFELGKFVKQRLHSAIARRRLSRAARQQRRAKKVE